MIVIPMAGLSSRFKKSGYELPKYMLEAHGKTLFEHSVESFERYFTNESFLFVALDVFETETFIREKATSLGIKDFRIVILDTPTRGQAETVYLGLKNIQPTEDESITIFNIDTFRPDFEYPLDFDIKKIDGYLETFIGSGKNWSNVLPLENGSNRVIKTAEKQEISEFCCTGLYYWHSANDFMKEFETYMNLPQDELDAGEYYIAPMYNHRISKGKDIRFSVIEKDQVIFCGIPDEYHDFLDM
jgi:NDP-sugar pyrophosphorylase family protein